MKRGKLTLNGVKPEPHELETIMFFIRQGKDIELIPASNKLKTKTADLIMDGLIWEVKCPCGKSNFLIRDTLRRATKQSNNIILDMRRVKIHQAKYLHSVRTLIDTYKQITNLKVITKGSRLIDIKKS